MTDFRALCAELLDEFVYHTDWSDAEKLKERARAALAEPESIEDRIAQADAEIEASMGRIRKIAVMPAAQLAAERRALDESDGPAVLDGREPASVTGQPSDEELNRLWFETDGRAVLGAKEYARAVLTRWGNPALQPPAEGEVEDVVRWLRSRAGIPASPDFPAVAPYLTRAADLLQRLSPPQPVPVSERLPGPEDCDCDDTDRVWCWNWAIGAWRLNRINRSIHSHWLPAHALPVPGQEVEG